MPTELFVDYLPSQAPVVLGAGVATAPAQGTVESWTVIVPTGLTIPAIGPSLGQLRAVIESEIVFITAGTTVSGTRTWTVVRGQEGSTPAPHANGLSLVLELTAGAAGNLVQLTPSVAQTGGIALTGELAGTDLKAIGTTGAPNQARYFGSTVSGAPTTGTWLVGDVVTDPSGLKLWLCTTGGSPGTWTALGAQGPQGTQGTAGPTVTWRGGWSSVTAYSVNDAVSWTDGSSYLCKLANTNQLPSNTTYWALMAQAGAQGPSGAGGGYLSNEQDAATYATFAAAITAIGSTPTALIVHTSMAVAANVTVPSTCSLVFRGTGQLAIATGITVTINGSLTAPQFLQIFSLTGTGVVNLGLGACSELWVEWFGAKGDANATISGAGTDSTAAIQAAINAVPPWGGMDIRFGGGEYRITSTLLISSADAYNNRYNMRISGQAANGGDSAFNNRALLVWDSASTTTPLMALHTSHSTVKGLGFRNCAGRTLACAIDIDIGESSIYDCTSNRIKDCSFSFVSGTGSGFVDGIHLGYTDTGNCEWMQFHSLVFNSLTGAWISVNVNGASQPFDLDFTHIQGVGGTHGITGNWGGGVYQSSFQALSSYAVQCSSGQFVSFVSCDSESCGYLLSAPTSCVSMVGSRVSPLGCSSTPGSEYIQAFFGTMDGVYFDATDINCRITGISSVMGCQLPYVAPFFPDAGGRMPLVFGCAGYNVNGGGRVGVPNGYGYSTTVDATVPFEFGGGLVDINERPYAASIYEAWYALNSRAIIPTGTMRLLAEHLSHHLMLSENVGAFARVMTGIGAAIRACGISVSSTGGTFTSASNPEYEVTWVTALGETLPGAFTQNVFFTGTTASVLLNAIPTGPAGVTARKIYRSDSGGTYGLVATIADNTTTTWTDTNVALGAAPPGTDTSGLKTFTQGGATQHSAVTKTTIGAAGAASALPTPVGYVDVLIGGTLYSMPYFNP